MFLYDENGMQILGDCMALGREGAIEIMNSSYGVRQPVDRVTPASATGYCLHTML